MKTHYLTFLCLGLCLYLGQVQAQTQIGDITKIDGIDENSLQGWGIVNGLNGKGDKGAAVKKVARTIFERLGSSFNDKDIEAKNMAIVFVTAKLPPFVRPGQKIDIDVHAISAESLEGGTLLATTLYVSGTDPEKTIPVVLAQGGVLVGNTGNVGTGNAGGNSQKASIPTAGSVVKGGVVLSNVEQNYLKMARDKKGNVTDKWLTLLLKQHNFTNAHAIAETINRKFMRELPQSEQAPQRKELLPRIAKAISPSEVKISVPEIYWDDIIHFISKVQLIELNHVENKAVVVVNERTGNITISGDVKLNECTVVYNGVTVSITKEQELSQVLQQLDALLNTKDQIAIIKQLETAGYLRANLIVE